MTKTESAEKLIKTLVIESCEQLLDFHGAEGVRAAIPNTNNLIMVGPAEWIAKNVPGVEAMVEASGEVAALLEENDKLRAALSDSALAATMLHQLNVENGGINAVYSGGAAQLLAEALGQQFTESGAENYLEVGFSTNTGVDLLVTLQRCDGKTPANFRHEAEEKLASALAEVEQLRTRLATTTQASTAQAERTGWEAAARALWERACAHHKHDDFELHEELMQCVAMLNDMKPAATSSTDAQAAAEVDELKRERDRFERMFMAACDDLGAISDELGLDSEEEGGADPIIEAIRALRAGDTGGAQ